jgi:hypothetical protein
MYVGRSPAEFVGSICQNYPAENTDLSGPYEEAATSEKLREVVSGNDRGALVNCAGVFLERMR